MFTVYTKISLLRAASTDSELQPLPEYLRARLDELSEFMWLPAKDALEKVVRRAPTVMSSWSDVDEELRSSEDPSAYGKEVRRRIRAEVGPESGRADPVLSSKRAERLVAAVAVRGRLPRGAEKIWDTKGLFERRRR